MAYYLFLKQESDLWVGHNPLAQIAMFFMYTLGAVFIIVTGSRALLPSSGAGATCRCSSWAGCSSCSAVRRWCARCITSAMWYLLLFALIHVYMVFREDIMSGESVIGTMINGIRIVQARAEGMTRQRAPRMLARSRHPRVRPRRTAARPAARRRARRRTRANFSSRASWRRSRITQTELAAGARRVPPPRQRAHPRPPRDHARYGGPPRACTSATTPTFWMHLQVAWDMHAAHARDVARARPSADEARCRGATERAARH